MIKLSIICLNYSAGHYSSTQKYIECIHHLLKVAPSFSYEILLVDNGSQDNSIEVFKKEFEDRIQIISLEKNIGFQAGCNKGIEKAIGEYICILNPDIIIQHGVFDELVNYLDVHEDVAYISPRFITTGTDRVQDSYRRFMRPFDFMIKRIKPLHKLPYFQERMRQYLMWNMDCTKIQEVDWIVGAFMIMPRDKFDAVGGYDERFFLFNGETDLCKSFWNRGWKVIYYPLVWVYHGESRLSGNGFFKALFKRTAWIHLADMTKYFLKWGIF